MGNLDAVQEEEEQGDRRWEIDFPAGQDNEHAMSQLFDVKAHFRLLGVDFPETLLLPMLLGKKEDDSGTGMRVVISLGEVRNAATRTVSFAAMLVPISPAGQAESSPVMSMTADTEFGQQGETVEAILEHLKNTQKAEEPPTLVAGSDQTPAPAERELEM